MTHMRYQKLAGTFLLLLGPVALGATISDGPLQVEQGLEATSTSLGYVEDQGGTNRALQEFKLTLPGSLQVQNHPSFKLVWSPEFQASPWNDTPGVPGLFESKSERYWLELPEGYLQAKVDTDAISGLTVQAGFNTFTWGVTDGFNPLDVVSAHRYQDPFRSEKLGAPSLSLKKDLGPFTLEGVYIPWQRKSILPGADSRWLPREILQSRSFVINGQEATIFLPNSINYSYYDDQIDDNALSNNYGARIQGQGILPGLDVSLEFFEGAGSTPSVQLKQISLTSISIPPFYPEEFQADSDVVLLPIYYRERVYGGTLVYANFDMIFRLETAITRVLTRDYGVPGSAETYVLSAEHGFPIGDDTLTAVLQGSYARHSDPIDNTTASLDRIFDRTGMAGLRYAYGQKFTCYGAFLLDTESHDELAHLDTMYSISDSLKAGIAGDGMWGSLTSPLGVYHKNDRAYLTLKYLL